MNVLDENIVDSQRQALHDRRIAFRQIGVELGPAGMSDRQVVALLHGLNRPTFFTRDDDFYDRELCHLRYCLVYIDAEEDEVAQYVALTLRHPAPSHFTETKQLKKPRPHRPRGLLI